MSVQGRRLCHIWRDLGAIHQTRVLSRSAALPIIHESTNSIHAPVHPRFRFGWDWNQFGRRTWKYAATHGMLGGWNSDPQRRRTCRIQCIPKVFGPCRNTAYDRVSSATPTNPLAIPKIGIRHVSKQTFQVQYLLPRIASYVMWANNTAEKPTPLCSRCSSIPCHFISANCIRTITAIVVTTRARICTLDKQHAGKSCHTGGQTARDMAKINLTVHR